MWSFYVKHVMSFSLLSRSIAKSVQMFIQRGQVHTRFQILIVSLLSLCVWIYLNINFFIASYLNKLTLLFPPFNFTENKISYQCTMHSLIFLVSFIINWKLEMRTGNAVVSAKFLSILHFMTLFKFIFLLDKIVHSLNILYLLNFIALL